MLFTRNGEHWDMVSDVSVPDTSDQEVPSASPGAASRHTGCCHGLRSETESLVLIFQRQVLFPWMLWTVKGIVLGTAACTERIYT